MAIRVLLVDDHEVVRAGVRRALVDGADIDIVGEAESGSDAYRMFIELAPDVVVLDLSLREMSGMEALRRILRRDRDAKIVVFTMHETVILAQRALQAGALGYVVKTSPLEELVSAVERVVDGDPYVSSDIAGPLAVRSLQGAAQPLEDLSPREFEVFRLVATGKSSRQIAAELNLSQKTVSNYVSEMKRKLNLSTSAEFTLVAGRLGLIDT